MARRFRFRLQPVLRQREIVEEQRKKEFALANRAVDEARLKQQAMQEERTQMQEDVRVLYESQSPFQRVLDVYRYQNTLELQLARNARDLAHLEVFREERRLVLVEAQKNRKAMELLRDKRRAEQEAENAREEQTALDELAVQARRRRMTGG